MSCSGTLQTGRPSSRIDAADTRWPLASGRWIDFAIRVENWVPPSDDHRNQSTWSFLCINLVALTHNVLVVDSVADSFRLRASVTTITAVAITLKTMDPKVLPSF